MEHSMIIQIKRFGEILTSRTEGREAALLLLAHELAPKNRLPVDEEALEILELNFLGIRVMTPSWLGELVNTLNEAKNIKFIFSHLENASVNESVEVVKLMPTIKGKTRWGRR
jgi:hypothetical protein